MVRLLALAAGLLLLACSKPDPAREQLAACHRQLLGSEPHQPADIIEVAEHYAIPQCMDQHGFVSKSAAPEEFLAAVQSVLAGGTVIEREIASEIAAQEIGENAYLRPLTQRDLEILRLLAAGNSLAEIGEALGIAYKTVANTLSRIKEKLGVTHR